MDDKQSLFSRNALLVEDQEVNARIAVHLMNQRGVNVTCASSGDQAVALFQASEAFYYDVIFTDIMMPGGSGMAEAQAIRALERPDAKTIPILALTASTSEDAVQSYLAAGMDDVLPKPIQPAMLDGLLEKWVPIVKEEAPKPGEEQHAHNDLSKLPALHTLDTREALRYADGDVLLCLEILKEYAASLPQRMEQIRQAVVQRDYKTYAMEFHKLRSAVATVGAPDLSEEAGRLEQAGKAGDAIAILKATQRFLSRLEQQYTELAGEFQLTERDSDAAAAQGYEMNPEHLRKELAALSQLLLEEKYVEADELVKELRSWKHPAEETDFLRQLQKDLRSLSYNTAIEAIRGDRVRYEAAHKTSSPD